MKPVHGALAAGVIALVGFGIWLGRSTSTSSPEAPLKSAPVAESQPVQAAPSPATTRAHVPQQTPTLAHRSEPAPGLAKDLQSGDPKIRRAALAEAVKSGDADVAMLLTAARDGDLDVASTAVHALAAAYANGQVPVQDMIARATDRSVNARVRLPVLNGLGAVENPDAAKLLVDLLARGDVLERRTAAILLQNQAPSVAVPALIDALADADDLVRANALESLKARSRGRDFGSDAGAWRAWWQANSR